MILILYTILNVVLAKIDANKIRNGIHIKHGINALVYCALIAPTFFISWSYPIAMLALRRIVFDTALNMFRGLPYDYISATTTSIIDRISYDFQKEWGYFAYYMIFVVIIILCL
jgi:hypothetical protein